MEDYKQIDSLTHHHWTLDIFQTNYQNICLLAIETTCLLRVPTPTSRKPISHWFLPYGSQILNRNINCDKSSIELYIMMWRRWNSTTLSIRSFKNFWYFAMSKDLNFLSHGNLIGRSSRHHSVEPCCPFLSELNYSSALVQELGGYPKSPERASLL